MKEKPRLAKAVGKLTAGLIKDLKARSMLNETLIAWATELRRTPTLEGNHDRGHRRDCFSVWLAAGGIKDGTVHGKTDHIARSIARDKVDVHDLHSTILHQMRIDPTNLPIGMPDEIFA